MSIIFTAFISFIAGMFFTVTISALMVKRKNAQYLTNDDDPFRNR